MRNGILPGHSEDETVRARAIRARSGDRSPRRRSGLGDGRFWPPGLRRLASCSTSSRSHVISTSCAVLRAERRRALIGTATRRGLYADDKSSVATSARAAAKAAPPLFTRVSVSASRAPRRRPRFQTAPRVAGRDRSCRLFEALTDLKRPPARVLGLDEGGYAGNMGRRHRRAGHPREYPHRGQAEAGSGRSTTSARREASRTR